EVYTELLKNGFQDDPGITAQLQGLKDSANIFKAQCMGQVEAFFKRGLLKISSNGHGMLIGYSTRDFSDNDLLQCLEESSKYIIDSISEKDMHIIQNNALKVASITKEDWYKKFIGNKDVFVVQIVVVEKKYRGTGVFRELISPILMKCTQDNIPVVMKTHNLENVKKYEHFGFKVMEKVTSEEINLTCYNLLKD
ncbi:MAG: GNAT family N-acetyltransferase, partial [Romboutsia sp.]|nr:GNAT family N-acetyltransferase [Romboutsia sp.]